jgi:hypothetical protein
MKKLMWAMVSALILTGCEKNEVINQTVDDGTTEVHFSVVPWQVTIEPMGTRATVSEAGMTDLWLLAYSSDTLADAMHQTKDDANFGTFSLKLKYGKYKFYAVSSRGLNAVVDTTARTITWDKVRDTFWAVDSMTVVGGSTANKTISMDRVVGRAVLHLTDLVPDGAQKVVFRPSHWYYGINYQTGAAVGDSDAEIDVNIPASYIGQQGLQVSYMSISDEDDWTTGMVIAMKGAGDAELGSVTLSDVPMGRNKTVTMTGALLGGTRSLGVSLNDTWGDSSEITW